MKNLEKFKSKANQLAREEMKQIDGGMKWTNDRSCNVRATYGPVESPNVCCSLGASGYTITPWGYVCN